MNKSPDQKTKIKPLLIGKELKNKDLRKTAAERSAVSINRYICIPLYSHRASSSPAKRLACQVAKAVDRGAGTRVAVRLTQAPLDRILRIGVNLNQMARALDAGAVSPPAETQEEVERVGELVAKLLGGERE